MKKKRVIDLSRIKVDATDTDADLMIKVRLAFPELLRQIARQVGHAQWSAEVSGTSRTGVKNPRSEREKFIRDAATEYLRQLKAPERQEIALHICAELKAKRDLLLPK